MSTKHNQQKKVNVKANTNSKLNEDVKDEITAFDNKQLHHAPNQLGDARRVPQQQKIPTDKNKEQLPQENKEQLPQENKEQFQQENEQLQPHQNKEQLQQPQNKEQLQPQDNKEQFQQENKEQFQQENKEQLPQEKEQLQQPQNKEQLQPHQNKEQLQPQNKEQLQQHQNKEQQPPKKEQQSPLGVDRQKIASTKSEIRKEGHATNFLFSSHTPSFASSLFSTTTSSNPVPKSLTRFFDPAQLSQLTSNAVATPLTAFANYIAPRILSRDLTTKKYIWLNPSPLESNARFYRDPLNLSTYREYSPTERRCLENEDDCRRRISQYFTQNVCDEIRRSNGRRSLPRRRPDSNEYLLLREQQQRYFKLLKIVCDSYAFFNQCCDEVYKRPFCNIQPVRRRDNNVKAANNNKKKLSPGQAKLNIKINNWKTFIPTKDMISDSIYDETAMACLATRCHYPTPLYLSLRHDYRSPHICFNTCHVLTLDYALQTVLKNNMLHHCTEGENRDCYRDITYRDHCTLRSNDTCSKLDECVAQNKKVCQANPQKELECAQRLMKWLDANPKPMTNYNAKNGNVNKPYNALSSLRPIDQWLMRVWATRVIARCNDCTTNVNNNNNNNNNTKNKDNINNNHCAKCDVRNDRTRFAKDIAQWGGKLGSASKRSALRSWHNAYEYHLSTCKRLSCHQRRIQHRLATSVPWSAFFSNAAFLERLQRYRSNLQPLASVWSDFHQWRQDATQNRLYQFIKLNKQCKSNAGLINRPTSSNNKKVKQEPIYIVDDKGRKCTNVITPALLKKAISKLRHVYPQHRSVDDWFPWLANNHFVGAIVNNRNNRRGSIFDLLFGR